MNETDARKLLVESGKQLLETGLVARTWGNVSCRLDEKSCVITPSGLDYMQTEEKDIVKLAHGGLCLNCKVCTFPACGFGKA